MVEKKVERRPVKDYEGYYEVDENGNVYSLDRIVRVVDGARVYDKPLKGKRLTPIKKNNGYLSVSLTRDGRHKGAYIHRIVAEAFLENPNNYNCINHKDEDRTNDCVGNLEWCSYSYNSMYNDSAKKRGAKYRGKASPNRKMITAFGDTKSRLEWAKESGANILYKYCPVCGAKMDEVTK